MRSGPTALHRTYRVAARRLWQALGIAVRIYIPLIVLSLSLLSCGKGDSLPVVDFNEIQGRALESIDNTSIVHWYFGNEICMQQLSEDQLKLSLLEIEKPPRDELKCKIGVIIEDEPTAFSISLGLSKLQIPNSVSSSPGSTYKVLWVPLDTEQEIAGLKIIRKYVKEFGYDDT